MKVWTVVRIFAAVILAVVLINIFLREEEPQRPDETGLEQSPAAQSSATDDPLERGRQAYFKHCVACHSPDTDEYFAGIALKEYFTNPPTELSDGTLFPRTDEAIRKLIEEGTKNMPPLMKGITPEELEDILAYMHTL